MMLLKTASWFMPLPPDHQRIGISRGVPRKIGPGYRMYRPLAPGPWFNSVGTEEFVAHYSAILERLDREKVIADLLELAAGKVPVLVCFEMPGGPKWCHRALAAEWLAEGLGQVVPEFGYETLPQDKHPLLPAQLDPVRNR